MPIYILCLAVRWDSQFEMDPVREGCLSTPKKSCVSNENCPACLLCGQLKTQGKRESYSNICQTSSSRGKINKNLGPRLEVILGVSREEFHSNLLCQKCERQLCRIENLKKEIEEIVARYHENRKQMGVRTKRTTMCSPSRVKKTSRSLNNDFVADQQSSLCTFLESPVPLVLSPLVVNTDPGTRKENMPRNPNRLEVCCVLYLIAML